MNRTAGSAVETQRFTYSARFLDYAVIALMRFVVSDRLLCREPKVLIIMEAVYRTYNIFCVTATLAYIVLAIRI